MRQVPIFVTVVVMIYIFSTDILGHFIFSSRFLELIFKQKLTHLDKCYYQIVRRDAVNTGS